MALSTAADSYWNKENEPSLYLNGMNYAAAVAAAASTPKPTPNITTLWVTGFDAAYDEKDIRYAFRRFAPIVCVYRPKDKKGNLSSHAYITLLSKEADRAITILNGRQDVSLHVRKAREQRNVPVAVVKNRKSVCRAYFGHGQCLETCPFGLEHSMR